MTYPWSPTALAAASDMQRTMAAVTALFAPWSLDDPMTRNYEGVPTSVTFAAPCPAGHDAIWRSTRDPVSPAASLTAYQCATCATVPSQPAPGGPR